MTSRPPARDGVEMRLQELASAARALRRQRLAGRRALVFAAADRPREAAVEAAEDGSADVRAQQHAAESRVDGDLVLVHGIARSSCAQPPRHIAQVAHADLGHVDGNRRLRRIGVAGATAPCSRRRRNRRATRRIGWRRPRTARAISRRLIGSGTLAGSAMCEIIVFGHRPAEQRLVGAQRVEAELAAARIAGVGSERHVAQRNGCSRHRKMPMFGML